MPKAIFQPTLQPVPAYHPLLPPMPNLNALAQTPATASASANNNEDEDDDDDDDKDEDDDLIRALAALQTEEMTLITDSNMDWSDAAETSGSRAVDTSASESSDSECPGSSESNTSEYSSIVFLTFYK